MLIKKLKKRRQLKKEEKKQAYREALAQSTGLYFSEEIKTASQGFPFAKYFVNALALFGSTYGSLACLISAFHLEISDVILALVCGAMALTMAFMYASQISKMIVYLLILVGTVCMVARYYWIINSGISAIHNICLKRIDAVFDLPQMREYTEFYTNQYISMTVAFCVLALALMIILNIFISEYMNLIGVFLVTFPIAQFGMYFSFEADKFPMLCVMGSWLLVAGVRYTNSYNGVTRKLKSISSVKKHWHHYGFVTDSRNVSRIALILLIFILALSGLLLTVVPQDNFAFSTKADSWKNQTNQTVKNYLSYGMAALFSVQSDKNRPGEIANSSSIYFDGQTDLKVRLVNYGEDRMYLRNYVGVRYVPHSYLWSDRLLQKQEESESEKAYNRTGRILEFDYQHNQEVTKSRHRIEVEIVDKGLLQEANTLFVPYYSLLEDKPEYRFVNDGRVDYQGSTGEQPVQSFTFYTQDMPKTESRIQGIYYSEGKELDGASEFTVEEMQYYNNAVSNYMDVPEENKETLAQFCQQNQLSAGDSEVVQKVVEILTQDYDYTLKPGKVPAGQDYVNYFLGSSKKGYCVHFASSATLLFRYLGIPARYVEGYVVDAQDFDSAVELKGEDASQWLSGEQGENGVVEEFSITDANGHAWVEIYEYGLGWVPVEVTQAASIDEDGGFFANLFGGTSTVSQATQSVMNQVNQIDVKRTQEAVFRFLLLLVLLFFVLYVARMLRIVLVRHRSFATADRNQNISNRYWHLYEIMAYNYEEMVSCLSYEEFSDMLYSKSFLSQEESVGFCALMEQAVFSGEPLTQEEYSSLGDVIHRCHKALLKEMKWSKRMGYYFVRVLW